MLDKSLVYKDIVMCLPFEELKTLKVPVLPDGYSYKMFEPGDEVAWANLEDVYKRQPLPCSLGEADTQWIKGKRTSPAILNQALVVATISPSGFTIKQTLSAKSSS